MAEQYNNLAASTTAGSLNNTDNPVTFSVQTGDGALFPATTNGSFRIVVANADGTNAEVMLCTSRTGDSLTCARGSSATGESPTPTLLSHASLSVVSHVLTVGAMNQVRSEINNSGSGAVPSFARKGALWIPTDDPVVQLYNGSQFNSWGPLQALNKPADPGTWINQNPTGSTDTIALSSGGGRLVQVKTGGDGSGNITSRVKAVLASKSFTLTVGMTASFLFNSFNEWGIVLTNGTSTSSSHILFGQQIFSGAVRLLASKFTSVTAFSADYFNLTPFQVQGLLWLRVVEDATHRTYFHSDNGQDWFQLLQTTNTDFLTSTNYGIFIRNGNAASITQMTVYSFKETNP